MDKTAAAKTQSANNAAVRAKSSRMPAQPIKLYYLPPSPPCRSVMMLARVMGLELDLVLTNIMEGQHMTPEYLKMNPQHTIPTMDDNGFILWESRAIMAYLVNAYGRDDSLYPKNPRLRAIVDNRLNFDLGTLFLRYYNLYDKKFKMARPVDVEREIYGRLTTDAHLVQSASKVPILFRGEEYNEESAAKLDEALGWLNTMLDGRAFVAGDNMTIADITIVVTLTNIDAFGYDFSAHDNVSKWFERTKKALEPYGYKDIDQAGAQILASFLKKD